MGEFFPPAYDCPLVIDETINLVKACFMFLANHCSCYAGVVHFEAKDLNNGREVTSWKVVSPDAIQVRNVVPLR